MKRIFVIFSNLVLLGCVQTSNSANERKNMSSQETEVAEEKSFDGYDYRVFKYPINNDKPSGIAYIPGELVDGGIRSLLITDDYCFLLDEVHCNIKKVSLKTGAIQSCSRLAKPGDIYLIDMAWYNDLIYVSTNQKEMFVLDQNLELITTLRIPTEGSYNMHFKGIESKNLLVFIEVQDTLLSLNAKGEVVAIQHVSPEMTVKISNYTGISINEESTIRNNRFIIKDSAKQQTFESARHKIKLEHLYDDLDETNLHATNLDFNDQYLVYYDLTSSDFRLHVYDLESK